MASKRKGQKRDARKKPRPAAPVLDDLPELQEARALWVKQDLLGALGRFDRAVREHPQHVRALVDASRAFGAMYNYERAESLLTRLVELGRGNGQIMHLAAQSYRILRRTNQAIERFTEALAAKQPTSESHLELALLYERRNQLGEALDHAEARLRAQPHDLEAAFLKARIHRRTGEFAPAMESLKQLVQARNAHWMTRGRAHAELAALLDEQGAYAEAWDAMLAGKQVVAAHAQAARAHRERLVPPLLRLASEVTADHFSRWRAGAATATASPRLSLLTGLPRSGTTLLERVLDAHPGIVACDEFDAFPRIVFPLMLGRTLPAEISPGFLDSLCEDFLAPPRGHYAQAMSAAVDRRLDDAWLLDKNPSLLPLLTPFLRFAPASRVIVVLRDPRDVLVSCLMAYLPLNDFSVDFLTLEAAADRLVADWESWRNLQPKVADSCLEVRYEDLVADLPATAQRVLAHLGLAWDDRLLNYRELGAARTVYSPSYDAVAQPLHGRAIGRWRNYEAQLKPVLGRLETIANQGK